MQVSNQLHKQQRHDAWPSPRFMDVLRVAARHAMAGQVLGSAEKKRIVKMIEETDCCPAYT